MLLGWPGSSDGEIIYTGAGATGLGSIPADASNVVGIAMGRDRAMALRRDGTVVAWGNTAPVSALSNLVAISCGCYSQMGLRSDGTITNLGSSQSSVTNAVAISSGYRLWLALRSDGSVTQSVATPVLPTWLSNVVAISVGYSHGLALRSDGTAAIWGEYGTGAAASLPEGLASLVAISAGYAHNLAARNDGTVVAWGDNASGQCDVPPNLSNVVAVAAGQFHSLALTRDGTVVGWGDNSAHQRDFSSWLTNVVAVSTSVTGSPGSLALVGQGAPFIAAQPASTSAFSGQPVLLVAGATGAWPLRYQWLHNGSEVPGATTQFLFLEAAQSADAGSYVLTVSNALGSATSGKAKVTILDSAPVYTIKMPTRQPGYPGMAINLENEVKGSAPLTFRWEHNAAPLSVTGPILGFSPALMRDSGRYSLIASNQFGLATNSCDLTIYPAIRVPSGYIETNWTDVVSVAIDGRYWTQGAFALLRDGRVVDEIGGTVCTNVQTYVPGSTGDDVSMFLRRDGTVVCISDKNQYGQANVPAGLSNVVSIAAGDEKCYAVRPDGTVVAWGLQASVPAGLKDVVSLAAAGGKVLALKEDGTVSTWDTGGSPLESPTGLSNVTAVATSLGACYAVKQDDTVVAWGNTNGIPVLTNVTAVAPGFTSLALRTDGTILKWGEMEAPVPAGLTNVAGVGGDLGYMHNNGAIVLAGDIAPYLHVVPRSVQMGAGEKLTMGVHAVGASPLTYQWQRNGTNLPGATGTLFSCRNLQTTDNGTYGVVVTNRFGTASATATLTVTNRPPIITCEPSNQVAWSGTTVTFTGAAKGSSPLTYQWQFRGTNLPGATDSSLQLSPVQNEAAGSYRLVVSNAYGWAASSNANLTVMFSVADALDTPALVWTTRGNTPWFGQSAVTHDGISAAQSGVIGNNQQSILETVLNGPSSVTFWWKVSSEQYWDVLRFLVNDIEYARISGEVDWQQRTFDVPAGLQTLQWVYSKDADAADGQDAAWLDGVSCVGGNGVLLISQPALNESTFNVLVPTVGGRTTILEYKNALSDSEWTTAATIAGDDLPHQVAIPSAGAPQRFFRVRQSP